MGDFSSHQSLRRKGSDPLLDRADLSGARGNEDALPSPIAANKALSGGNFSSRRGVTLARYKTQLSLGCAKSERNDHSTSCSELKVSFLGTAPVRILRSNVSIDEVKELVASRERAPLKKVRFSLVFKNGDDALSIPFECNEPDQIDRLKRLEDLFLSNRGDP
jgi:hypothetical protein